MNVDDAVDSAIDVSTSLFRLETLPNLSPKIQKPSQTKTISGKLPSFDLGIAVQLTRSPFKGNIKIHTIRKVGHVRTARRASRAGIRSSGILRVNTAERTHWHREWLSGPIGNYRRSFGRKKMGGRDTRRIDRQNLAF